MWSCSDRSWVGSLREPASHTHSNILADVQLSGAFLSFFDVSFCAPTKTQQRVWPINSIQYHGSKYHFVASVALLYISSNGLLWSQERLCNNNNDHYITTEHIVLTILLLQTICLCVWRAIIVAINIQQVYGHNGVDTLRRRKLIVHSYYYYFIQFFHCFVRVCVCVCLIIITPTATHHMEETGNCKMQ